MGERTPGANIMLLGFSEPEVDLSNTKHTLLQNMDAKTAARRAATIRRQNVQRHHKAAAVSKLRHELQRHTANRNAQMELGRLQEASLRHTGLDRAGLARMHELLAVVKN